MVMTGATETLAGFFEPPNEISLEALPEELGTLLGELVELEFTDQPRRTVLPARSGGLTRWYGFSPSSVEERLLLEEIRSWVGSPIGSRVQHVLPTSTDPLDQHALRVAGDRRVVRTTIAESHLAAGRTALRGLLQLWAIAPSRVRIADRPVGRVLRDFYQALVVGDRQMAESAIDEIRSRGLLSATNVRFLLVDLLSATGTASELRTDSRLAGISLVERPPRVTESLAQAAGQLFFHWTGDIQSDDVKRIALDLEDCWPNLVTSRSQAVSLATARCLAAVEALADEQRPGVLRFLAASPWSDDPFVAAVAHETAPSEPSVTIDPYQLLVSGELEEALDAAIELGHSDVFTVAVFAAYELGTVEAAKAALGFFERLDQSAVAGVTAGRVVADRLEALREKQQRTGWTGYSTPAMGAPSALTCCAIGQSPCR